jgi:hypothetical protein
MDALKLLSPAALPSAWEGEEIKQPVSLTVLFYLLRNVLMMRELLS